MRSTGQPRSGRSGHREAVVTEDNPHGRRRGRPWYVDYTIFGAVFEAIDAQAD